MAEIFSSCLKVDIALDSWPVSLRVLEKLGEKKFLCDEENCTQGRLVELLYLLMPRALPASSKRAKNHVDTPCSNVPWRCAAAWLREHSRGFAEGGRPLALPAGRRADGTDGRTWTKIAGFPKRAQAPVFASMHLALPVAYLDLAPLLPCL